MSSFLANVLGCIHTYVSKNTEVLLQLSLLDLQAVTLSMYTLIPQFIELR